LSTQLDPACASIAVIGVGPRVGGTTSKYNCTLGPDPGAGFHDLEEQGLEFRTGTKSTIEVWGQLVQGLFEASRVDKSSVDLCRDAPNLQTEGP
jgi:hypothetical protein